MDSLAENLPSSKALSSAITVGATAVVFLTMANELIPRNLSDYFSSSLQKLSNRWSSQLTVVIEEFDGLTSNLMFEAADVYLGSKVSPWITRIKVKQPNKSEELAVTVDKNQEISDLFENVKFKWRLQSAAIKNQSNKKESKNNSSSLIPSELRYIELSFHKKHKDMVLKRYLPFIQHKAKAIKEEIKAVKLNTVDYSGTDYWGSVVLNHPATFETVAMDPEKKRMLIEDIDKFVGRRDYYRRIGRAWKRGYLFYGPPGTGKSSLVAAMANYLKFDVYDLDLREVQCNSDLRRLLIGTANRSILVIEDIDCNVRVQNRESESEANSAEEDKLTLSGILNFIDGLWSSCGDERIIIFTTNHKDRLDPALLRPGRMDVHLEMSYCSFSGFKTLAYNYLKIVDHKLFGKIEVLLAKVQATPAEVARELMMSDDAETALQCLIESLLSKQNSRGHGTNDCGH